VLAAQQHLEFKRKELQLLLSNRQLQQSYEHGP
jgi:hypothetical protein